MKMLLRTYFLNLAVKEMFFDDCKIYYFVYDEITKSYKKCWIASIKENKIIRFNDFPIEQGSLAHLKGFSGDLHAAIVEIFGNKKYRFLDDDKDLSLIDWSL